MSTRTSPATALRPRRLPAVATMLIGALLGQGLVIAVSPLLTRTYGPSDFGALAIVTAVASILGAGATIGTDRAVIVSRGPATRALVLIGVSGAVSVAMLTAVVGFLARRGIADAFSAPVLVELWWVLPCTTLVVALQRLASAVLARQERHGSIATRNALQGVGQTVWNLGASALGPIGLVGGLAAGRMLALVGVVRPTAVRAMVPERGSVRPAASQHRRYLVVTPWSAMLNVVGQQAPSLLLAAAHGSTAAGFISLTMRVLGAPVGIVADAVAQFAAGRFGSQIRAGRSIQRLLIGLTVRLVVGGSVAAAAVIVLGPTTFRLVFGDEWAIAGEYARVLAPAFAIQVAVSPMTQVLTLLGRQTQQLVWDIARLVLTSGAVLVSSVLGAPTIAVLASLSAAMIASYASMLVMVFRAVRSEPAHGRSGTPVSDMDRSVDTEARDASGSITIT